MRTDNAGLIPGIPGILLAACWLGQLIMDITKISVAHWDAVLTRNTYIVSNDAAVKLKSHCRLGISRVMVR